MGRHWRWAVVALATVMLLALPLAARLLPAGSSSISAAQLLTRIDSSSRVPYSGFAQSHGGLNLPVDAGAFSLADLLGGTSQMRVWWRSSNLWRVDEITASGELDLHLYGIGVWSWDYESNTTRLADQRNGPPVVRIPRADDLLPPNLARRLLSQVPARQVSRLPNARVAGEEAAGLRMQVADTRSTIDHVDVWALPSSGLPLRVAAYDDQGEQIVSSTMLDLSLARPALAPIRFVPPPGSGFPGSNFGDIVSVINQFGISEPPTSIGGLPRVNDPRLRAVGEYGSGVTQLIAIPLTSRLTRQLVPQVRSTPGAVEDATGIAVGSGPLNLQLSPPNGFGARWLLVGTVTAATLRKAVPTLPEPQGFGFGR